MTGGPVVDVPTSTTFELPGYTVERTLGLSWGLIVRSVGLTQGGDDPVVLGLGSHQHDRLDEVLQAGRTVAAVP